MATTLAPTKLSTVPRDQVVPWTTIVVDIVAVAAVGVGLLLRLWLIFHLPTNSDMAVVGIIAQGGLQGHFTAFFSGQNYGGTAEAYLIAGAFFLFGQTGVVAEFVEAGLAALAAVLTWRIALRMVPRKLALLAGVLAWTTPAVAVRNSVRVFGFRGVTLACGLGLVLVAVRMLDGRQRIADFALLGGLAGIGWWSSPEIAYFAIPTALLVGAALLRSGGWRTWVTGGITALGAAFIGALPWVWANVESGLASLRKQPAAALPFSGRLSVFFRFALPMEVGLRRPDDGAWMLGSIAGPAFIVVMVVLIAALALCLARGGRTLAVAVGVLAFPILYAVSPASWAWQDGRYGGYIVPLLAIVVAVGCRESARWLGNRRGTTNLVMAGTVVIATVLAVAGLVGTVRQHESTYVKKWQNPDASTLSAIAKLRHAGVSAAYADYFVAYKLDFLSEGRLTVTTVGYDDDRSESINSAVHESAKQAWLFVPKNEASIDGTQFSAPTVIVGPDMVTQSEFIKKLDQLGDPYHVIDVGLLRAVIPQRSVTPYQARMPGVFLPWSGAGKANPSAHS